VGRSATDRRRLCHAPFPGTPEGTNMSQTTEETKAPEPGTGHHGQTFLVGEHVYLRTIVEDDAKLGMSWMNTIFPRSTSRVEKFITEEMKEERDTGHLVVVRKSDDRIIGSITFERWNHAVWVNLFVDPLFGEQGQRWLGEAIALFLPWYVDEQHRVVAYINNIPDDQTVLRDAIVQAGARPAYTFREFFKRGTGFIDAHNYEYLNRQWVETLGDPINDELPRSGTGEPRPVIAPVEVPPGESLPLNAMRVGPRVYLRPLQKEDAKVVAEWQRKETEGFWSGGRYMSTTTALQKWFEGLQEDEPQEWVRFAVCLRETDEMIGAVGIDGIDYQNRRAESESEFHRPDYRGGGYGTEAKHLMFDYAFNTLGLHSLQSWVMFSNTRSAAALRKQGYAEVGREHWLTRASGRFENFHTYELLASTWRAMPRTGSAYPEDS
jgi:RimJ/RimL family protein N-acetyltransferase